MLKSISYIWILDFLRSKDMSEKGFWGGLNKEEITSSSVRSCCRYVVVLTILTFCLMVKFPCTSNTIWM